MPQMNKGHGLNMDSTFNNQHWPLGMCDVSTGINLLTKCWNFSDPNISSSAMGVCF